MKNSLFNMVKKNIFRNGKAFTVLVIIICAVIPAIFWIGISFQKTEEAPFFIRVRVLKTTEGVEISSSSPCRIRDLASDAVLNGKFVPGDPSVVSVCGESIKVDGVTYSTNAIRIVPEEGKTISVNKTEYRGEISAARQKNVLFVVNKVKIGDYLKGVLPREAGRFWPSASLEAQAIVSRTFAVNEAMYRKHRYYDLTADTYDQVYGGKSAERWREDRAVDETAGKVLTYEGKVFPAYFHSCCGGHTEDAWRVWNEKDIPPLRGVKCFWCRWSPRFRWQAKISTADITQSLRAAGYEIDRVDNIATAERDKSGRVKYLSVKSGNRWYDINVSDFAAIMGKRAIKSANIYVKKYPFFYYFSGYGWGHGAGMCQWGAFFLGFRWWSAERIVLFYYPGAKIEDLNKIIKDVIPAKAEVQ